MLSKQHSPNLNAALLLADGSIFRGKGIGAPGITGGEVCFNTSMSGYQEIMTDPSYAGQMITFTFPHIGNVGANRDDLEAEAPFARGIILRADITAPSNYRAEEDFNAWLARGNLTGICDIDTRALTRHLRDKGAQNGVIAFTPDKTPDIEKMREYLHALPDMNGQDIARTVSCTNIYEWHETPAQAAAPHVVVIDYGVKRNILRCLARQGMRLTVVPCSTTFDAIMALKPDGIFLSNGPGDPAATGVYAVPVIQSLLQTGMPLFGICLGHQLLARALGGETRKLPFGHRGGNHPVKDLETGKVEITSQNHGFHVVPESLPETAEVTHQSLFDGTNEGLRLKGRPVFSVQYHPEASPGPHDSHYLFERFAAALQMQTRKQAA
ncbi:MAG TPA: glutamine-hydrolyzing carbamoyl-phosphate synthase small subunit [Alphaproteobacteria bacterium]|nr:carbamoyl phosphate synthase small subunit [Rhodospirillaceae bacterium]HRJ67063.1 glutamine-hydrolyzing carbamoyl-phosphate synthase small subunit [Alphaproteobacteria bacterium]